MATRQHKWLPKREPKIMERGVQVMRGGEPDTLELHHYGTDQSLRAVLDSACCDCGLRHILAFEVFRDPKGRFYLNKRSYRIGK